MGDQAINQPFHGRIGGWYEREVFVSDGLIDNEVLELVDGTGFTIDQTNVTQDNPSVHVEPELVVNPTQAHPELQWTGKMTP